MDEKLKRKNSDVKRKLPCFWLIFTFVICIGVFACFYSTFLQFIFGPPILSEECEVVVTDTLYLRIQAFICDICGNPRNYQISRNRGKTWDTFHSHLNNDDPIVADCSEFQVYSPERFYFLPTTNVQSYLMVTHDAGETWHQWRPDDLRDTPQGFECHGIAEVHFQDRSIGYMQLTCNRYHADGEFWKVQNINLFTRDGGINWELTYE